MFIGAMVLGPLGGWAIREIDARLTGVPAALQMLAANFSAAICGALEIVLIFLLVPGNNYLVGAVIFSAYLALSISWNALRGLSILRREEAAT